MLGIPDTTDFSAILLPRGGRLIGIQVVGKPATGDSVTCVPVIGGTVLAAPSAVITSALPTQVVELGPNDGVASADAVSVAMQYITATGGTYTVRDVYGELVFELLDD